MGEMNSCFPHDRAFYPGGNIFRLFLTHLLIYSHLHIINASSPSQEKSNNQTTLSKHPVIIIVSYDGFRYDYMNKVETPNLDTFKLEGISAPYIMNQFPTKTFPNHHSIATGLHTESHGVTDNTLFDLKLNRTLSIGDEEFFNYRDDILPLWTLNEMAGDDRISGTLMWPGSDYPFGPKKLLPTHSVKYDPSIPFEKRVDTALSWITNATHPSNLVFMYFEQPDAEAHGFGPDSPQVLATIQTMDNLTGYLIGKLKEFGIFEKVNLILLSDHGFQNVPEPNVLNISKIIDPSLYDCYGDSPVFNINPIGENLDILYSAFQNASKTSNFSVYKRDELNRIKPHWFYHNNPQRIMPLILVADSGYVFEDYGGENGSMAYFDDKFNVSHNKDRVYGVHGYDNDDRTMQPYFLAHGPNFGSGKIVEPFYNVDIFPLICLILDFPAPPNNGSLRDSEVLLFRKGFHVGATIGWAIGIAVILAFSILLGVVYLLRYRRERSQPLLSSNVSYRFVNNLEHSEDYLEDTTTAKMYTENGVPVKEVEEFQALLLSSSNEEL